MEEKINDTIETTSTSMKSQKTKLPLMLGVFAILVLAILFIALPNGPKVSTEGWVVYSHPFLEYSAMHPSEWVEYPRPTTPTAIAFGTTEDVFVEGTENQIKLGEAYFVVDSGPVTLEQYKTSLELSEAQYKANVAANPELEGQVSLSIETKEVVTENGYSVFRVETTFTNNSEEAPPSLYSVSYLFEGAEISFNLVFWSDVEFTEDTEQHMAEFEAFVDTFEYRDDITLLEVEEALGSNSSLEEAVLEAVEEQGPSN
ncbi:MAG: hypothetical protein WDZ88_02000 [Candidatus Paceibacterota bacterium]